MISPQIQNMTVLRENTADAAVAMDDDDVSLMDDSVPTNLSMDRTSEKSPKLPMSMSSDKPRDAPLIDNSAETPGRQSRSPPSETKIHLSFSVDRLLSNEKPPPAPPTPTSPPNATSRTKEPHDDGGNEEVRRPADKCCDNVYSCCMYPSCLVGSQHEIHQPHQQRQQIILKSASTASAYMQADNYSKLYMPQAYADFKSIVRPTPIRALGNNCDSVTSLCPPFPPAFTNQTGLFRFHHTSAAASAQQQHLHHQSGAGGPKTHPAMTPIMMTSLAGLKSLQMHQQHAPRFGPHKSSALLHHHEQTSTQTGGAVQMSPSPSPFGGMHHHHHGHSHSPSHPHQHQHHHHQLPGYTGFPHLTANGSGASTAAAPTNASGNGAGGASGSGAGASGGSGAGAGGSAGGTTANGKRKRSWSRAVFSNLQRKGLEIQFQQQKYITKPDRRKLAARLNLTDAQVKVWFQNRRMKWRHTRENLKSGQEKQVQSPATSVASESDAKEGKAPNEAERHDAMGGYSSDGSSIVDELSENEEDDDEIDVVE